MRSGSWRPFEPTISVTSHSSNSCITPSPTPTLSASNPSFAALAGFPKRRLHAPRKRHLARTAALVARAVLHDRYGAHGGSSGLEWTDFALATLPAGADEAGGPPLLKFYGDRDILNYSNHGLCVNSASGYGPGTIFYSTNPGPPC